MKTIQEQIEVMTHYANGGETEIFTNDKWGDIVNAGFANWNFAKYDFRIKEQNETIIIEKWLLKAGDKKSFFIAQGDKSYLENYHSQVEKVKLLETYEVEL